MIIEETRVVKQDDLSSECWGIQLRGLKACEQCEFIDGQECGGQSIRKTLMNEKGHTVPLKEKKKA